MKKTIVILLVLVIGMVGVLADESEGSTPVAGPATINITSKINPIDKIGLLGPFDENAPTLTGTWAVSLAVTVNTSAVTPVAWLHAISNNRGGVKITMTAQELSSGTIILPYKVITKDQAGADVTSVYPIDNETGLDPKLIVNSGDLTELTPMSRRIFVEIPTYDVAPTGTYTGSIVFDYEAP